MTSAIIFAATTVTFWICGLPPDASPCRADILIQSATPAQVQQVPLELIEWGWDGTRHKGEFWNPFGPQWAALSVERNGTPLPFGNCGAMPTPTPAPDVINETTTTIVFTSWPPRPVGDTNWWRKRMAENYLDRQANTPGWQLIEWLGYNWVEGSSRYWFMWRKEVQAQ